ncbi:hypothetical protein CLV58_104156 [Spirosoma oryzae]|uniref:O-antigen ligase-like membrane protein n=1 Tax=Spirosoma oryzae TaxID=1469603 RepID=A0A2T0TBK4_9BACT|nr:hypothetical protein [Spirosoma oryzae]PRY43025.1 hypothetical protein CLV58_104156 [Spirosoma oryzae]
MVGTILTIVAIGLFFSNRFYGSLLIFVGLATKGFLLIPQEWLLAGLPIEKTSDMAIMYIVVICLFRFSTLQRAFQHDPVLRWILIFILFVFVDGLYSRFILGYELNSVVRVFRNNLFLLSFFVFMLVPVNDLTRVWHTLAIITLVQCVLFLLQIPTGTVLLGDPESTTINNMESIGWVRYYNLPTFLIPTLFYYLFAYEYTSRVAKWLIIGLLLITVVAPMHRSLMLIIAVVASVYILAQQTTSKRFLYVALLIIVGNGAMMIGSIQSRVNDGLADINKILMPGSHAVTYLSYDASDTFTYRIAHLAERFTYVIAEPARLLFGIGLLTEDSKQAGKLTFEAGLYNQHTGEISQVDTSDIAWSLLILYVGVVGTVLFIILHVRLFRCFLHHRNIPISIVGALTLGTVFLISFTGVEILYGSFRISMTLMLGIAIKGSQALIDRTRLPYTDAPLFARRSYPSVPQMAQHRI